MHRGTNDSGSDEYRSVIDDLTIENQKLKERLRKYERLSCSPHLDMDKLFEVKIHGLPSKKRQELEETLRTFAAGINDASKSIKTKSTSKNFRRHDPGNNLQNPSSTSTSHSRPVDSAYASMLISGRTSLTVSNKAGSEREIEQEKKTIKNGKIQSFIHDIPDGLLPRRSTIMTERQKKRAVIRRLEQLFTGRKGFGEHTHPLKQQEVSRSATRADRAAYGLSSVEGLREANILPYEMEVDTRKPRMLANISSQENQFSRIVSYSTTPDDSLHMSPNQRPTRPSDLDPDRAQIPSDNVEYIRHLGLSNPTFSRDDSTDAAAASEGWIYLNILVNMAQLHMINVTPDFVRSVVAGVSEKFQLSRDGNKVRWRGGTNGTRLSSESCASSDSDRLPQESDGPNERNRKRRKFDLGKFASAPIHIRDPVAPTTPSTSFHYKPLFHHQVSSSEELDSFDESGSPFEWTGRGSEYSKSAHNLRFSRHDSRPSSYMRRSDHGPIVFYSGAPFCTDLSGDRGNISTPLHLTGVGKDGYSNHTQDALGSNSGKRPQSDRTDSGSLLPFRPFKNYLKGAKLKQAEDMRCKTPEPLKDELVDLDFSPAWSSGQSTKRQPLQAFTASGLGGTQPADHFAAKVETRRTILSRHARAKLSRFPASSRATKRFYHRIPEAFLNSFGDPHETDAPEGISSALAQLNAFRSPSPQLSLDKLPVKIELVSAKFSHLEPSPLPAPSIYYATTASSEDDSTYNRSSEAVSHLHMAASSVPRFRSLSSSPN